jgi:RNA polymerase sigma-70 factor (ECF subfamily)
VNIADHVGLCSKLTRYAMRLTRNREDAEDLTQDVLLQGFVHQAECSGIAEHWLKRIMFNRFVNSRRRAPMPSCDAMEARPEVEYPSQAEANVTLHEVSVAIDLLSPSLCECFCLRAYGLEYSEIAAQLGIPVGTVKSRIWRARERLEAVL